MDKEKSSLLVRFLGLAIVIGGLSLLYFSPQKVGLSSYYLSYLPKPWKAFSAVIGAWAVYACYLHWETVSKRLKMGLGISIAAVVLSALVYFATVAVIKLVPVH